MLAPSDVDLFTFTEDLYGNFCLAFANAVLDRLKN
jgi:hypothetical protein